MEDDYYSAYNRPVTLFEQVKKDIDGRNALGMAQHHRELTDDVALDWLRESYEELLDLCIYLKGEINKRERCRNTGPNPASGRASDSV